MIWHEFEPGWKRTEIVAGKETLDTVANLNAQKKFVLFAPNHLKPQDKGPLGTFIETGEDYLILRRLLDEHGLTETRGVMRADLDFPIGDSSVKRAIYHTARKVIAEVTRVVSDGGVPVASNERDSSVTTEGNTGVVGEMKEALKKHNLIIFPYGSWFQSGEQDFDEKKDLANGEAFPQKEPYDQYRKSLKPGFVKVATQSNIPIVPVYVHRDGENWSLAFGSLLTPQPGTPPIDLAKQYLASMRELKEKTQKPPP